MTLTTELGLVAHGHLGLGKLYRRTGQRMQADEHLSRSCSMFAAMDMKSWSELARAEQRLAG